MSTAATVDPRFTELHKRAADSFATAAIFQRRSEKYERLMRVLTFFGLVLPIVIGGIVMGGLADPELLKRWVYVAGVLAVVQVVIFLWSVVANWPDRLNYASSANALNTQLSNELHALAIQAAKPPADFDARFAKLEAADNARQMQDQTKNITEKEKVYGRRTAMIQFQTKCVGCEEVPLSMKMVFWGGCPSCGGPKKK